jgi:hypothetical protein
MMEDIRWAKTHCARMDHGGCGLLVGVKGNAIVQIKGDPARQFEWQRSNFNRLTSVEKLGKEFGTPNLKNLPCRIRRK